MGDHALLTARDIHGPFVQLQVNLQGEEGAKWLRRLKKFNREENPFQTIVELETFFFTKFSAFTPPEVVTEGVDTFLFRRGARASHSVLSVLEKSPVTCFDETVHRFAAITPEHLGFSEAPTYQELLRMARRNNLWPCPRSAALMLAVTTTARSEEYKLIVATSAFRYDDEECLFFVEHSSSSTKIYVTEPTFDLKGRLWDLEQRFLFLMEK